MPLSIKNYAKELPKELIQLAAKNKVRECDETEKGHYVAYVDEGKESFDVSLNFLANGEISAHSCECKNGATFCRHKTALLMHIAKGDKIKVAVRGTKKSKLDPLLEDIDTSALKDWLNALFKKNKEVYLSFTHQFSPPKQQYLPEDVVKIANDSIKVVAGAKKHLDASQLKKLVDLWKETLTPVINGYLDDPANEASFDNINTLLDLFINYTYTQPTNSNRLVKYINDLILAISKKLENTFPEENWKKAVSYLLINLTTVENRIRIHYFNILKALIEEGTATRVTYILDSFASQIEKNKSYKKNFSSKFMVLVFNTIYESEQFEKYIHQFTPVLNEDAYNSKLIKSLHEKKHYKKALITYAEVVPYIYTELGKVPFWELARDIYKDLDDEENAVLLCQKLLQYTFKYEDYKYASARMNESNKIAFSQKIQNLSYNNATRSINARNLFYHILDESGNYSKMIDNIDADMPYTTIVEYFEPMFNSDKTRFLERLISRHEVKWNSFGQEITVAPEILEELYDLLIKFYTREYIEIAVKNNNKSANKFRFNRLFNFINLKLGH